jgi:hypothetical protein
MSGGVTVNEAPLPSGVQGNALEQHIFETLDDLFNQPVSAVQILGVETALMTLQNFAVGAFAQLGFNPLAALSVVQSIAQQEFDLLAKVLAANGADLNGTVGTLETAFILQSQTELLFPGS